MIVKHTKGRSFRGVLNYLWSKEGATHIGGNMAGVTPRQLSAEFQVSRLLNPRVERAVYHASLSLPHHEHLDEEKWKAIASSYLEGMGFTDNQYVIVRHTDRDHDHIHLVASRIKLTGECVHDSWDHRRAEALARKLEQDYQLAPVQLSWEVERSAPTTGEMRYLYRQQEEFERHQRDTAPEPSARMKLQALADRAAADSPTMTRFLERLKAAGVEVKVKITQRTETIQGISYAVDGVAIAGNKLGKAYSWQGLQTLRGVSYDSRTDWAAVVATATPSSRKHRQLKSVQPSASTDKSQPSTPSLTVPTTNTHLAVDPSVTTDHFFDSNPDSSRQAPDQPDAFTEPQKELVVDLTSPPTQIDSVQRSRARQVAPIAALMIQQADSSTGADYGVKDGQYLIGYSPARKLLAIAISEGNRGTILRVQGERILTCDLTKEDVAYFFSRHSELDRQRSKANQHSRTHPDKNRDIER